MLTKALIKFICKLNLGLQEGNWHIVVDYDKTTLLLIKKLFSLRVIASYKIDISFKKISIFLYTTNSRIRQCTLISRPGKRFYISMHDFSRNKFYSKSYLGRLFIVSTNYGFYTLAECFKYRIGGELLCIF